MEQTPPLAHDTPQAESEIEMAQYEITVVGIFNLEEDAELALSAMEDAVGKYNGDLEESSKQTIDTDDE